MLIMPSWLTRLSSLRTAPNGTSGCGCSLLLGEGLVDEARRRCVNAQIGEASDYGAVDALMAIPVTKPKALLADKGYDGDTVRENLLMQGILPIIPPKANRREPIPCDFRRYRDRNRIERMFGHLKQFRRIATRYDKTALSFTSFLNLAAIRKWLPNFVNAA